MTSFRATFGLTRSIGGWEEGERRERNKEFLSESERQTFSWSDSIKKSYKTRNDETCIHNKVKNR